MRLKAFIPLILIMLSLTACGKSIVNAPLPPKELKGTIIENPSHLSDQPSYLLVNDDTSTLLAYLTSKDISLSNFIDQAGTVVGTTDSTSLDGIPILTATKFVPITDLPLEEILKNTVRREAKQQPFNKNWDKDTPMLVLQSDSANASAQIQVTTADTIFIVKLVRNQANWHIADMESRGYSSPESSPSTGSGETL